MSSQSSGVPIIVEKGDVHTESIQQSQPIDLAAHRGPAVVQLRPVRTFSGLPHHGTITAKPAGGPGNITAAVAGTQTSIISVNRTGPNLTILPARGQPGGAQAQIPTYQIARGTIVGNVRSNITSGHHQPGSITVTPISTSNFGTNIRLTGPVNNGTWIQSSGNPPGAFAPLRAATITVSGRAVRPDGKMIHIPQGGSVQHVTQLQMVDNKGSILKPQITTTPIMRGTLHPQGGTNTGTPLTLPLAPFTIRAANIANLPTIQQRPQNANANTANQVQKGGDVKPSLPKVITSPAHGPPIQLLNAQKLPHTIQTIPIPRLNTVCLTLSTHGKGTIAPNNTAPVVAMASRQGNTSLIMTPSISGQVPSGGSTTLPNITKVYPVSRDVTPVVETFFAATSQPGGTVSSTGGTTVNPISHHMSAAGGGGPQTNVVIASSTPSNTHHLVPAHGANSAHHHGHHLVQVHGSISVNSGVGTVGLSPSTMTQSYYHVDPNNFTHGRPIAIEKRTVTSDASKGIMTGSTVILTSAQNQPQHHSTQVTLAAHGAFSHSIPMSHHHQQQPSQQILQSHSILTPVTPVSSSMGGGGGITTISSIPGIQQAQHVQIGHSAIPTHVISQTQPANISSSSSLSSSASVISVTPSSSTATTLPLSVVTPPTTSVIVTTSNTNSNIINNHSMNSSSSNAALASSSSSSSSSASSTSVTSSSTCPVIITTTATSCSNSIQTSTPAQSPSQQTKSTLSPRPSILRKREAGDNHHALPLRAQRNLAFSVGSSNVQMAASASAAAAAAAANKENSVVVTTSSNSVSSVSLGPSSLSLSSLSSSSTALTVAPSSIVPGNMSILKKEFQPPNEESSWQSCSSNSSSGSTTISTTSETAEIQLQQQQQQIPLSSSANIGLHVPTVSVGLGDISLGNYTSMSNINNILGSSIGCSSSGNGGTTSTTTSSEPPQQGHSVSQNGIVRSASVRSKASGKSTLKDLERVKGRQEKDDGVSPRKKPRKQQLTTSDLFDSASPEISFYQGKRFKGHFKKSELMDPKMFEEFNERLSEENAIEEAPSIKGVAYYIKKPHMSLLQSNKFQSKPPHNHFQRYCDVKSKDERRPTVNDLLNQKNVMQKANGWKLQHLNNQVEQVIELEGDVVHRFSDLLTKLETKIGPNCSDRDLNRIMELLKGNIQRGKVIRDQMLESKTQVLKILEHKPRILDVITKYNSKRPIKKRERL